MWFLRSSAVALITVLTIGCGSQKLDTAARETLAPCVHQENAFRAGVNPPRLAHREEPELSGLPPIGGEHVAILEVRIDASGRVTESCLLRGVREDVDRRALDTVKRWRFEPPRLLNETDLRRGGRRAAGTAVPIFMTVTIPVGRR